jgi:integron integrase
MIEISPDTLGRIKVSFPYSPAIVAKIRSIRTRRWHPEEKYWSFPHSAAVLHEILSTFSGEELDIDQALGALAPQVEGKRSRNHGTGQEAPSPATLLLDQVRHTIRIKHYSTRTEETYLHWIMRYLLFHKNRNPQEMAGPEVETFLSYLAVTCNVAASTQNVAFNALLFLYRDVLGRELGDSVNAIRAKKPKRLPTVMTKEETMRVIAAITPDFQLMVKLTYGSGLRFMECIRLRVKDIDFGNNHVLVRDAKGMKDRVTILPNDLRPALHDHLERVKFMHRDDVAKGYGRVYLPYALERKYPRASTEWAWQYVFPARSLSVDPRSGETRRHHIHENGLQRAVRTAALLVGYRDVHN